MTKVKLATREQRLISIGKKIRVARVAAELTQEDLAVKINSHRQTIGLIEDGRVDTGIKMLFKIADALKVNLKDLISNT